MDLLNKFLGFELLSIGEYSLRVGALVLILAIIVLTKVLLWGIKKSIFRKRRINKFRRLACAHPKDLIPMTFL